MVQHSAIFTGSDNEIHSLNEFRISIYFRTSRFFIVVICRVYITEGSRQQGIVSFADIGFLSKVWTLGVMNFNFQDPATYALENCRP